VIRTVGVMTDIHQQTDQPIVDLAEGAVIHLGLGARATPLRDFTWDPAYLQSYMERFAPDGDEGRLVGLFHQTESWSSWERHPAGEEIVLLLSGRADLLQQIDGEERRIALRPGQAVVNPTGVWHTADVHEPGDVLTITPGRGTDHKPR
jgi:mannose-6-phosphate isomerase-like protein (cupin superfamily)